MLILPGDPLFNLTLASSMPPGWQSVAASQGSQIAFAASADSGVLRPVNQKDMIEYLYGGEYDERMNATEEEDGIDDGLVTFH